MVTVSDCLLETASAHLSVQQCLSFTGHGTDRIVQETATLPASPTMSACSLSSHTSSSRSSLRGLRSQHPAMSVKWSDSVDSPATQPISITTSAPLGTLFIYDNHVSPSSSPFSVWTVERRSMADSFDAKISLDFEKIRDSHWRTCPTHTLDFTYLLSQEVETLRTVVRLAEQQQQSSADTCALDVEVVMRTKWDLEIQKVERAIYAAARRRERIDDDDDDNSTESDFNTDIEEDDDDNFHLFSNGGDSSTLVCVNDEPIMEQEKESAILPQVSAYLPDLPTSSISIAIPWFQDPSHILAALSNLSSTLQHQPLSLPDSNDDDCADHPALVKIKTRPANIWRPAPASAL